jgi:hypothetical protein
MTDGFIAPIMVSTLKSCKIHFDTFPYKKKVKSQKSKLLFFIREVRIQEKYLEGKREKPRSRRTMSS